MDGDTFRLFVSVELPAPVIREIAAFQAELRGVRGVRISSTSRMHLTLAFLGDTFVTSVPAIQAALGAAAQRHEPFTFVVSGAGFFGPPRAPRVVWAGVPAGPALAALQADVARALAGWGAVIEARDFRPHVTVARCGRAVDVAALTSLLRSFRSHPFGKVDVDRIGLMRSVLDQDPPQHLVLAGLPLKGKTSHAPESPARTEG